MSTGAVLCRRHYFHFIAAQPRRRPTLLHRLATRLFLISLSKYKARRAPRREIRFLGKNGKSQQKREMQSVSYVTSILA